MIASAYDENFSKNIKIMQIIIFAMYADLERT